MKYNRKVQLYLSDENFRGRYFRLPDGKLIYLKRFKGQDFSQNPCAKTPAKDLKDVFKDLLGQAYEMGCEDGRKKLIEEVSKSAEVIKKIFTLK